MATEQLLDMEDPDEAARYADGVRRFDFDAYLAPYDLSSFRRWTGLSHLISAELVAALSPVGSSGNISIMAEADDPELLDPKTDAERDLVRQLKEGRARRQEAQAMTGEHRPLSMVVDGAAAEGSRIEVTTSSPPSSSPLPLNGRCFYTHLPERLVKKKGLSAAELTSINLDKSPALLDAASGRYCSEGSTSVTSGNAGLDAIIGELQFAFIAFVYGQSLDGFSQASILSFVTVLVTLLSVSHLNFMTCCSSGLDLTLAFLLPLLQWKALLMLMLGCENAALHSHQAAFVELMRVLRMQLQAALGTDSKGLSKGEGGDLPKGEAPFGLPMIEELLPDSFLRKMFGSFFHMLQVGDCIGPM